MIFRFFFLSVGAVFPIILFGADAIFHIHPYDFPEPKPCEKTCTCVPDEEEIQRLDTLRHKIVVLGSYKRKKGVMLQERLRELGIETTQVESRSSSSSIQISNMHTNEEIVEDLVTTLGIESSDITHLQPNHVGYRLEIIPITTSRDYLQYTKILCMNDIDYIGLRLD